MKLLKNRYIIAAVCVFAAACIAFFVLPSFYQNKEATTTVYRAAANIQRGEQITAGDISAVEVGAFNLPPNVVTDSENVIGKIALTEIPKDDFLLPDKVGDFLYTDTLDKLMKQGKRLVSLTLPSTAAAVAGHIEQGDIVSVACFIAAYERFETDSETGMDTRIQCRPRYE
ncbi:hypothetical protein FACS1894208_05160 [Clostridia bacterium]|nr:hypothetical protein FACS1894208_05160 [Clostridia bacterium]